MSKTKKSKLLASMLCATVVAGLYAGPVMAGTVDSITGDSAGIHINIGYDKDSNTSISNGVITGSDGLYMTSANGNGWMDDLGKIVGKLTISSGEMVKALEGQKFTELTIGGQAINATTIGDFKTDYSALKAKVDALDTTDLTGRVDALEKNTASIKRDEGKMTTTIKETNLVTGQGRYTGISEVGYNKISNKVQLDSATTHNRAFSNLNAYGLTDGFSYESGSALWKTNAETSVQHSRDGIASNYKNTKTENGVASTVEASSKLTATGIVDEFIDANGNKNTVTTNENGTIFSDGITSTVIKGDSITTGTINAANGSYGMLNGNQLTLQGNGNKFSVVNGNVETTGTVTAAGDIVANGTSLVKVGTDLKAAQEDIISNTDKINAVETAYKAADEELTGKITTNANEISRVETEYKVADTEINARIDGLSGVADGLTGRVEAVEQKTDGIKRTTDKQVDSGRLYTTTTTTNNTDIENGALSVTQKTEETKGNFTGITSYKEDTTNVNIANGAIDVNKVTSGIGELATTTTTVNVADGALKVDKNLLGTTASIADGTVTITGTEIGGVGVGVMNVNGAMNTNGLATFNGGTVTNGGSITNGLAVFNGGLVVKGVAGMSVEGGLKVDGGMHLNGIQYVNGDVVVNDSEGNELYSLKNIGYNTQDISYANGVTTVSGVEFKEGTINANSLNLAGLDQDVATEINDLKDGFGNIGGDLTDLTGRVGTLETNTAGITNDKGVTVIDQGLKVKGEDGREVFTVARDGAINAVVTDGVGGTSANFALNGENVELKYGNNGIIANVDGTTISGNGTNVVVNENGTTFTNANGTTTVINGGAITADTLNLANLDEDVATEINNLKDSMDTVGGDVSDLRNDVAQNTNDIGLLRTDVGVLRTDVNTLRVDVDSLNKRLEVVEDKTQNINGDNTYGPGEQPSGGGEVHEDGNTDFTGNINSDSVTTGEITADKGTIGGVTMEDGKLTADEATIGDVTVGGSLNVADKVTVDKDGVTVKGDGENSVKIDGNDVSVSWKDDEGNSHETSIRDNYEAINDLDNRVTSEVNRLDNRISKVEDRIDKVGAMSAAIANLRTMGYDPTAPTEIAVGIGQYRSETGAALGLFHYPNKDFMLSLSVSTSGDEVMGGIGATWKFGRKTPEQMLAAEKEKAAKAKLAKAEAMKKAAAEAKVAAQQAKHAKMAAEKAAK